MTQTLKTEEKNGKLSGFWQVRKYLLKAAMETKKSRAVSDDQDDGMMARIMAKLKSGKKLSPKELDYLKKHNPALYALAVRVQRMIKALEEKLKNARSKEEANDIIMGAMLSVSKQDPAREYLLAAINDISKEFHDSKQYASLPDTNEEADKKLQKKENRIRELQNEDEYSREERIGDEYSREKCISEGYNRESLCDSEFDLISWSPLTEVYEAMPKFKAEA